MILFPPLKIDIIVEIVVFIMNLDKHSNREFVAILLALLVFFMLLQLNVVYFRFWSMPMIKCFFYFSGEFVAISLGVCCFF